MVTPGFKPRETFNPARAAILQLVSAGIEIFLHRRRNPELKRVSHEGSIESFRRDADNRVLHAVEHLRLADNGRIAVVALLPGLDS